MVTTPKSGTATSSMKISGTLDTGNIERGFTRVIKGFDNVKGVAKGMFSDMVRVSSAVGALVNKFKILGVIGPSAIIGIAAKAPATAPAIARLGVEFDKLSRNLGQALAPAFEKVVGWMTQFSTWVGTHQSDITAVAGTILDVSEKIGTIGVKYLKDWSDAFQGIAQVPAQGLTAAGVGLGVGLLTKNPLAGAVAGGLAYGAMEQFERQTEFQTRVGAGQETMPALFQSFAPGKIGDFYAWLYSIFTSSETKENRRIQTVSQEDTVWG